MANKLINSFNKTNLDLQSPGNLGGPNRTNAANVSSRGTRAAENPGPGTVGGTPIKLKNGQDAQFTLNAYTPKSTYLDKLNGITPSPPGSPIPVENDPGNTPVNTPIG